MRTRCHPVISSEWIPSIEKRTDRLSIYLVRFGSRRRIFWLLQSCHTLRTGIRHRNCRRERGCWPWRVVRLHTRIRRRVRAAARARGANVSAAVILAAPALSRPPAHVTKGRAERAVLNIRGALDTLVCPSSAVGRGHAPRTAVGLACV